MKNTKGLKEKEQRATFILHQDQIESIKAFAYFDRVCHKDIVKDAIAQYCKKRKDHDAVRELFRLQKK